MSVSTEQIIAFITAHCAGVTTAMVGDHFRLKPPSASSRCSKLQAYGLIDRRYVARKPSGRRAVWRAKA